MDGNWLSVSTQCRELSSFGNSSYSLLSTGHPPETDSGTLGAYRPGRPLGRTDPGCTDCSAGYAVHRTVSYCTFSLRHRLESGKLVRRRGCRCFRRRVFAAEFYSRDVCRPAALHGFRWPLRSNHRVRGSGCKSLSCARAAGDAEGCDRVLSRVPARHLLA